MLLTIKSVLNKQMIKEFMLVFALMLFALATYYVIQFAHGKAPVYTGVVAIISLLGSVAYPIYYFSPLNSVHREQVVDAILPIGALVERVNVAMTGPLDDAEGRVRLLANDAGNVVNTGIDRATSGVANATFAYAGTALVSTALTTVAPAAAGILGGPLVWLFAALAFLMGISRHPNRRVLGGKRKLRR
jgi:Tfp pilus assembly protein PilE